MVTGWWLIWLITFAVFILILLVIVKWSIRGGTKMVDKNRVEPPDTDNTDMP